MIFNILYFIYYYLLTKNERVQTIKKLKGIQNYTDENKKSLDLIKKVIAQINQIFNRCYCQLIYYFSLMFENISKNNNNNNNDDDDVCK